ncbi:MAG: hypothetical protein J7L44_00630 [Candidatus Diapherotrites archaeon]|nr:hypothetical protein [Candidatus Diapherotrites archaeon]
MSALLRKIIVLAFSIVFVLPAVLSAECSDLRLDVYDVAVREDTKASFTFYLQNNSEEHFYIDRVSAFDFEEGIATDAIRWDRTAESFGNAAIVVGIEAYEKADEEKIAHLQVRGHFLSGKVCHYYQLKSDFKVEVVPKIEEFEAESDGKYCELFELEMPESIAIENLGTVDFTVKNYTNQDVLISVSADGATLETTSYFIPAKTIAEKKLVFASCEREALISFTVDMGACGTMQKYLHVVNLAFQEEPVSAEDVEISYTINEEDGTYVLEVTLRNKSNYPLQGILFADVPEDWNSESYEVFLAPFSEEKLKLRITPSEEAKGTASFYLVFEYDGVSKTEEVVLELSEKAQPFAGLFTLALAGIFAGVVVLFIVLIIGAFASRRVQKEPWMEVNR